MPQEIIGTPKLKIQGTDKDFKAVHKPSPADRDRNQAVPETDMQNDFPGRILRGIRKPDQSPVGPSIFDKES